jgi:hypothetical protein
LSSDFLTGLSNSIQETFGLGDSQLNAQDILNNGHIVDSGPLGQFAKQIDQSSQRQYLEEGYLRYDWMNVDPKFYETLWQEPDMTVLLKKRAFSTLAENFRSEYMDEQERLYYRASKFLLLNKCRQIAALEKLSKIERVATTVGRLDYHLMPIIINLVDQASNGFPDLTNSFSSQSDDPVGFVQAFTQLNSVIDKVRTAYAFSSAAKYTTWLTDVDPLFRTDMSYGTGVIELTNVANLTTNIHIDSSGGSGGSFSFSLEDPYKLTRFSNYDIEQALSDANNLFFTNPSVVQGQNDINNIVADNINQLNQTRVARGASAIEFVASPDTLIGKKLRAIIDALGVEIHFTYNPFSNPFGGDNGVSISPDGLQGSPVVDGQGLTSNEATLFSAAVKSIYDQMQLNSSTQANFNQYSNTTNHARKMLRFHYGGKFLAQPLDRIHVYMKSKSRLDGKILGNLQNSLTGLGYLQSLDNNVFDLKNQFGAILNPSGDLNTQMEKSMFLGDTACTNDLWFLLRNLFVTEQEGTHVFAGIVQDAQLNWSQAGKFVLNVSGSDNMGFLEMGTVNLRPAVDTFNGPLFDPLTPFQTKFDTISDNFKGTTPPLLSENQELLGANILRHKSGRLAGQLATQGNLVQSVEVDGRGGSRNILYLPDGLVYRWKQGIGMFVQFGNSFDANNPNTTRTPAITQEPFAGQDIMNVLSLLITGQPYNYATYFKAAAELDNIQRDPQNNRDPSSSFYLGITSNLQRNNQTWGDFIPFKQLTVPDQTFQAASYQLQISTANSHLDDLLSQAKDLQNQLTALTSVPGVPTAQATQLQQQLSDIQNQITSAQAAINRSLSQAQQSNTPITIVGNDVSYDPSELLNTSSTDADTADPENRALLRKKLAFLTRRMSWTVRANQDKNLLIVDDSYDKDYDILAFGKSLSDNLNLFNSEFTTVKDKIGQVAQLLNLEVFCDTQGHLRIRPEQYNRMPSSVFYRMIQLRQQSGIQLFPQFIEDLFVDQLTSLRTQIEVIENQIRLDAALLGVNDDTAIQNLLNSIGGGLGNNFQFISDPVDGAGAGGSIFDLRILNTDADPDTKFNSIDQSFTANLANQVSTNTNLFNGAVRAQIAFNLITNPLPTISLDRINAIKQIIMSKTGQPVSLDNFLQQDANSDFNVVSSAKNQVDVIKITADIAAQLSTRQRALKNLSSSIKNAQEAVALNDPTDTTTTNKLLFPDLYGNQNIPEIFENMIEDESYDDLGLGSSSRYVIHNYQIISLNIREQKPPYTYIEVQGLLDPYINRDQLPGQLNDFATQGNALVTGAAIDYDMWRIYGVQQMHSIPVPFLSNPQAQCAPYAASLLARARRNIFHGDITIAGNEYMQVGEVVYIEDLDMLFYVVGVSHEFSFNGTFRTRLELSYGHNPGEYIPTPTDIIGKLLYNNRDQTNYVTYRQQSNFNESNLGAFALNPDASLFASIDDQLFNGSNAILNSTTFHNVQYISQFAISNLNLPGSNVSPTVELRIFFNGGAANSNLQDAANSLQQKLTGTGFTPTNPTTGGSTTKPLNPDAVKVIAVDLSNLNNFRTPSSKAYDLARNTAERIGSTDTISSQDVSNALYGYIIDCTMYFNNTNPVPQ